LFSLGAQDHLVGVTSDCKTLKEARKYTTVGTSGYLFVSRIRAINPDYVLMVVPLQEKLIPKLTKMGLRVVAFPGQSVEGLIWTVRELGRLLNKKEEAERLAVKLESEKERYERELPQGERVKVFVELSYRPLYTVGGNTYLNELIMLAGGVNIFADREENFVKVSDEEVIRRNPDVILLLHRKTNPESVWMRPGWKIITAAHKNRVYVVPDVNLLTLPGPRFSKAVEYLKNCFFQPQVKQ